jgi:hypothetical protein
MNLLQQVATFVRVAFVRSGKPFERGTERRGGLGIPLFPTGPPGRITHSFQLVAKRRLF